MTYFIELRLDIHFDFVARKSLATEAKEQLKVLVEILADELKESLALVDPKRDGSVVDLVGVHEGVAFVLLVEGCDFLHALDV